MNRPEFAAESQAWWQWSAHFAIVGAVTGFGTPTALYWLIPDVSFDVHEVGRMCVLSGGVSGVLCGVVAKRLLSQALFSLGCLLGAAWGAVVALLGGLMLDLHPLLALSLTGAFVGILQLGWFLPVYVGGGAGRRWLAIVCTPLGALAAAVALEVASRTFLVMFYF